MIGRRFLMAYWCAGAAFATQPLLGNWESGTPYPFPVYQIDPAVTATHVYVVGGRRPAPGGGEENTNEVYYAAIHADGTLGSWQAATPLPVADQAPGAAAYNGWLYVITNNLGFVYRAQIQPDGSLGPWLSENQTPSGALSGGRLNCRAYNGRLYTLGGGWPPFESATYFADINPDGSLGPWVATTPLPGARQHHAVLFHNDRVYAIGGVGGGCCTVLDEVISAPINADGSLGAWRSETALPFPLWGHSAVVVGGRILVFGGRTDYGDSGAVHAVYAADVNVTDGTLSSWTQVDQLPGIADELFGLAYASNVNVVYLIAGRVTASPPLAVTNDVWRTMTPDCNGNGMADTMDILQGVSADCNQNGIPDECDLDGDADGDGDVDLSDLSALLANFGTSVYP